VAILVKGIIGYIYIDTFRILIPTRPQPFSTYLKDFELIINTLQIIEPAQLLMF
jgi:hypothetical protein